MKQRTELLNQVAREMKDSGYTSEECDFVASLASQAAQGEAVGVVSAGYAGAGKAVKWNSHANSNLPAGTKLYTAPPTQTVPDGWLEFIAECATFAGKMVNGNSLSERATDLLAAALKEKTT